MGTALLSAYGKTLLKGWKSLGTNAMATGAMLKAGANKGASGENAIVQTVRIVDIIIGTTAIVLANSVMGN